MTRNRGNKPNTKFEKLPFAGKYFMKNIPVPTNNTEYMKKLIAQMEKIPHQQNGALRAPFLSAMLLHVALF